MTDVIKLLPDAIANQIAAGEVVQRPASVVKELVENAIDAKSTDITVIIKEAGKVLIQVVDNGVGMSLTDARMSFERHATSKIRQADDLFALRTLGFRGEALASIAAVAQVEMKTRQQHNEVGTVLVNEGSAMKRQEPTATPEGTSIAVKNLFFNVPARRNFLKSNPVEMRHILDEFYRVALANPDIAFSLYHNDAEQFKLPAAKLSRRIVNLFGNHYKEQLVACEEHTDHMQIQGYVGKPEFAKKTRGEQYFFVNNRFIKSGYLHHAVTTAYEGLLAEGTHPFYVLFVDIDPKHIDINVHPTKTEIKFDDERTIYGIMQAAVRQAMGRFNVAPSIDFDVNVNFKALHFDAPQGRQQPPTARPNAAQYGGGAGHALESINKQHWQQLYQSPELPMPPAATEAPAGVPATGGTGALTFESAANDMPTSPAAAPAYQPGEAAACFQVNGQYIFCPLKSGVMIVDHNKAHERVLYEQYMKDLQYRNGATQQSLFPERVVLNPADYALVKELAPEIGALGFAVEFGKEEGAEKSLLVQGMPAAGQGMPAVELFEGIIEQIKNNQDTLTVTKSENLARAMARRTAMKQGQRLVPEEMNTLIDQLFACKNPNYAPNGQRIFYMLNLADIEAFFNQ